ncbi:FAD-dependent monooxygenase [Nisaea acidiphila]|uniref:FAD-dependent monooxygenase n=1 Tax=Nisaea acidiphila TaxID=1862145 RepID=A0A9J7ATJ7_9PROT|nr:FAD-dependent monooxygenase [Nisaea acidiphila]UUX50623.1 FAD-dependent monooxygenase [Nisaea acidiphila]
MRIAVVGGGPAGLYFSYLMKRRRPETEIRLYERNPEGATFGFGVVFSDTALAFMAADDPETHDAILPAMETWRDLTLDLEGERIAIDGIGFAAIGRLELIRILTDRARSAGIDPRFETELTDLAEIEGADLIVGADGLNSLVRGDGSVFGAELPELENRFIWYGTDRPFDTLTQSFRRSADGPFNAHHYRYTADLSTFIVETDAATWNAAGFDGMDEAGNRSYCEDVFSDVLAGHRLISNKSHWRRFPKLSCQTWHDGKCVLIGDAAHTAHFSIGSGTRLAMEDALALASALLAQPDNIPAALTNFETARKPICDKIVGAANRSAEWYEDFARHLELGPAEFAHSYIQRSGRISDERLRSLAPRFFERYSGAWDSTEAAQMG